MGTSADRSHCASDLARSGCTSDGSVQLFKGAFPPVAESVINGLFGAESGASCIADSDHRIGAKTAIVALVIYNQYLLLRNFLAGLEGVDQGIVEAATGMGMTHLQLLWAVQIPLAKKALIAGLRIALVSTVGIATIAASVNAGGLGTLLFDGLRTMNTVKILWGSFLSAAMAVGLDRLLLLAEHKSG